MGFTSRFTVEEVVERVDELTKTLETTDTTLLDEVKFFQWWVGRLGEHRGVGPVEEDIESL